MKIEQEKIENLIPYGFNNRIHSDEQIDRIANSIKEFGFNQPLVIDGSKIVIVGHGRLMAAKKLGLSTVPVVRKTDLTEAQIKAYRILDNKLQNDSEWELDNLQLELSNLEDLGFDLESFGLNELKDIFPTEEPEVYEDDGGGELPEEPFIKTGDLIELGEHRLLCGDSTNSDDVATVMNGQMCDLCFTSPPYNAGNAQTGAYSGGSAKRNDFKKMYNSEFDSLSSEDYRKFLNEILKRVSEVVKPNAVVGWNVCYNAKSRREYGAIVFAEGNPLPVQETIVWDKSLGMNVSGTNIYSRTAELVFLLSKTENYKSNQNGGVYWNIWRVNTRDGDNMQNGHGASFPIGLPAQAIRQHSDGHDIVFDPFLGSGTTLIAADQLGRKCYGLEISPQYCQVIINRYRKHCEKVNKPFECKVNGEKLDEKWLDQ